MKVPHCKAYCVGEVTSWGKQFLSDLQAANVIETAFQSPQEFITNAGVPTAPVLVCVENTPESKKTIQKLRASGRLFFLLWYGRGFSKEDLAFAIEHRAYAFFEHARSEDKKLIETVGRAAACLESAEQFDQIIHALKSLLLQSESEEALKPLVTEIKTAVAKLERCGLRNELAGPKYPAPSQAASAVNTPDTTTPFYKTQDFGDALTTVHDLERTGVLFIRGELPGNEGKVEFIQGKIVSAAAGDTRGMKAVWRMFLWDQPRFMFSRRDPQDCFVEEPVSISMKHLCQEGEELRRRYEAIRREVPPLELKIELEPTSMHAGTRLSFHDFSTLASVVEFGRISHVIDNNPLPDVALFEALIRLKKGNMIRVSVA